MKFEDFLLLLTKLCDEIEMIDVNHKDAKIYVINYIQRLSHWSNCVERIRFLESDSDLGCQISDKYNECYLSVALKLKAIDKDLKLPVCYDATDECNIKDIKAAKTRSEAYKLMIAGKKTTKMYFMETLIHFLYNSLHIHPLM